ncbi:MAG: glycosyl hydrolase [Opitutae bacterium]|nr:glycosyl hydrolase [Opitutae bacterium]
MIRIDSTLTPAALRSALDRFFALSAQKIQLLEKNWSPEKGTPVFTIEGRYTSRGWTEWTQGFQYGSAILQFAATGDRDALAIGREGTLKYMASHVSHIGVHDHGFNNVSTYGNLLHLARAGEIAIDEGSHHFYELALKITGAVQAARWTDLPEGLGYIYSFNGPHSLFSDTVRSLRALALSHRLGHVLMGERDRKISLLTRLLQHAETTARYNVYFGTARDIYDLRGRVVHESIFNTNDGSYRCPSTQQGYSPFSTWTRGLAWILCGYAEQLEFLATLPDAEFPAAMPKAKVLDRCLETALATADFYLEYTPTDGVPYWDTGAPGLVHLGDYLNRPADPFNDHEPVDSSAAAIAAQGLLRLGRYLQSRQQTAVGARYFAAGLTVARTIFSEPYLATAPEHQGLLLHSVYHRPNGWDHVPAGRKVPCGESCLWGDYHARELALLLQRCAAGKYYTFFGF